MSEHQALKQALSRLERALAARAMDAGRPWQAGRSPIEPDADTAFGFHEDETRVCSSNDPRFRCAAPSTEHGGATHLPATHRQAATDRVPSLFGAQNLPQRPYRRDILLSLSAERRVRYRGEQLGADDAAVFTALLDRVSWASSESIEFSPRGFLRSMRWGCSGVDQARLRQCLLRLQAGILEFEPPGEPPGRRCTLSLIARCEWRASPAGRSGRWRVRLAAEIVALFARASGAR